MVLFYDVTLLSYHSIFQSTQFNILIYNTTCCGVRRSQVALLVHDRYSPQVIIINVDSNSSFSKDGLPLTFKQSKLKHEPKPQMNVSNFARTLKTNNTILLYTNSISTIFYKNKTFYHQIKLKTKDSIFLSSLSMFQFNSYFRFNLLFKSKPNW